MTTNTLDPDEYVRENRDLIAQVLARGTPEARAWALALVKNGASVEDIEAVQERLKELKREVGQ